MRKPMQGCIMQERGVYVRGVGGWGEEGWGVGGGGGGTYVTCIWWI